LVCFIEISEGLCYVKTRSPRFGIYIFFCAVSCTAMNRAGRIGNRVRITDGTAAVCTDGQIEAKAGHWGNLRRQICPAGVFREVRVRRPAAGLYTPAVQAGVFDAPWKKTAVALGLPSVTAYSFGRIL
jgi:hypothetical protein